MRKWIESRLSELGKTKAELARHLDLPFARVSEIIKGKRELKSVEILPIAQFLQLDPTSVLQLLIDPDSKYSLGKKPIAVAGKVGAGAKVPLYDAYSKGDGFYHVACPADLPHDTHVVAVEVEGDSMVPVYQDGDVLFYSRDVMGVPNEAIGRICVCEDTSGDVWVKHIRPGSEPGKFHLISVNPLIDNMFDRELKWAAPVRLHWPHDLVEKMEA